MTERKYIIAVIGGAECTPSEEMQAAMVGRMVAVHGATLICGGRGGVMEAACGGARAGGGLTVGVLPGNTRDEANPYVDVPIVTGMGDARNAIIINSADAVIAVGGGYGTLSEIAFALKRDVPVVGLSTWSAAGARQDELPIIQVGSAEEAVKTVIAMLESKAGEVSSSESEIIEG
ncbi:MAG: TIGR00725 family protein [Anaerolineae bacterium]|nr:TIGR00725 family protein [Anaerolineae bacterium]